MNILITHAYSNDNKGDAALLSVLVADVKRAFADASITILTLDPIVRGETFEGVPVRNALMQYVLERKQHPLLQGLRAGVLVLSTFVWAVLYRSLRIHAPLPKRIRETVSLYEHADLIIPVGGGYILSKKGLVNTVRLFLTVYPFLFSHVLGKITINYAQSIGPFGTSFQAALARYSIKRLNGIIVRESISKELLASWHIHTRCEQSVDSGFSFIGAKNVDIRTMYRIPNDRVIVGLTVRSWFKPEQQVAYEKAVAEFCDYAIEHHHAHVVFIPQVTVEHNADDDRESSKRVFGYLTHQEHAHVAMEQHDHRTIKAMYAGLDYLIGTRFHSVIFALTSYVPAIAIGYEYKTQGIMNDLGLREWVIAIEQVSAAGLIARFDALVRERAQYEARLHAVLPSYIEQSKRNIEIVKRWYEAERAILE